MVALTVLSRHEAASALIRMRDAHRRLPNEEVDRRLRRWREE
jgi:hypothetical protein